MTFLAFEPANIINCNTISYSVFDLFMVFGINTIEFIAITLIVIKVDLGFAVAVDAPSHAQRCKLVYFVHCSNFSMAGLALLLACSHVLGMVEINMVRQVMYPDPFNGFPFAHICSLGRVPARSCIYLLNFLGPIHFRSIFTI